MRPLVQDQDLVGVDDGGEAVGDDQRGHAAAEAAQAPLDGLLGGAVQGRGGLVQDQDARALEDGAGEGHALLLAARQLEAALADQRGVAVGQAGDEAWSWAASAAASISAWVASGRPKARL